jgi:hypothetical protein
VSRQATADVVVPRERASASVNAAQRPRQARSEANGAVSKTLEANPTDRSLSGLQRVFLDAITTPEADSPYLDEARAALLLTPGPALSAFERLDIYRSGYHARLIECLVDDYPVLQHALGESAFSALCRDYIAKHPSRGPSLNVFGRLMAEHCRQSELAVAGFAADLAALEWAIVEAIHAPGGSVLVPQDLQSVEPEAWSEVRLLINPSLRVLSCGYPVNSYFQAHRTGNTPQIPGPNPSLVAVYRTGRSIWRLPLDPVMKDLLAALREQPLGAATAQVAAALTHLSEAEAGALITRWFTTAVSSGLFSGLQLPSRSA